MNVRGLQRNVKNVVLNFSDAQVKVREATSNDPWGPSSTLMSEIADLTYNNSAFAEIMQMIWKRLNDHGRNWRHVYKALVLLEYLIKTGSEKVSQQCRENIFAIQTLKDFQYFEENKDQGMNVREKSKFLVTLLKDDEKLKVERARALKAKERFAQSMSYSASGGDLAANGSTRHSHSYQEGLSEGSPRPNPLGPELENARPQTIGEEELQLQLALAMSKEEHEAEEKSRRNEELRLQLAIKQSQVAGKPINERAKSAIEDLLSLNLGTPAPMFGPGPSGMMGASSSSATDPWGVPLGAEAAGGAVGGAPPSAASSVVGGAFSQSILAPPPSSTSHLNNHNNHSSLQASNDPWGGSATATSAPIHDPWQPAPEIPQPIRSSSATNDPWSPSPVAKSVSPTPSNNDPWKPIGTNGQTMDTSSPLNGHNLNNGSAALDLLSSSESPTNQSPQQLELQKKLRKTPEAFLGANKNLVNLDALVSTKAPPASMGIANPFAATTVNPFQAAKPPAPSINELRMANTFGGTNASPPTVGGGLAGLDGLFSTSSSSSAIGGAGLVPSRVSPSFSTTSAPLVPAPSSAYGNGGGSSASSLIGASSAFSSVNHPANLLSSGPGPAGPNSTNGANGNAFNPFAM